ncbi:MAG: hypothetical protein LBL49_02700 [Clostridiales Family XIII bacterium]|nr:hypothetical protein [Clostridiales Family XIII bacterium]
MKENKFRIIKGGLHHSLQSSDKLFSNAFATNTRLMGVFVLYIHWMMDSKDYESGLHQFFYIDAEEFGIESYRGILGDDADALYEVEQSMLGGLGGSKVDLTEKEALYLAQRFSAMSNDAASRFPTSKDEFMFLLSPPVAMSLYEESALFYKLCVSLDTNEQLINYFLMRFFARDAEAVRYLSGKSVSLASAPNRNSETLCKNTIERYDNDGEISFLCESLIENSGRYQLVMSELYIDAKKISAFLIRSSFYVSATEAAMMLGRPEYITVYEILGDLNDARNSIAKLYPGAMQKNQESGALFLQFKSNNDHLKEAEYRLNDDIRGIYFITEYGQLIAVSYSLGAINRIEKELQVAIGATIIPSAKYEFKESVFYEFVQGDFAEFSEFMDYLNEYEPED